MSTGNARELDIVTPISPLSPSRFKLHGPRDKPRGRAASFQDHTSTSTNHRRRHTLVLQPSNSLSTMMQQTSQRPSRSSASAEELEAARWREEVLKLMMTAEGHKEIQQGLERFRQRGMPSLATTTKPGRPTLITCSLPSACSCGPCLRAGITGEEWRARRS
ncbi:hypothetical protein BC835DRAFT_1026153 [Cytidiella melzeri]|nr:hypothetical protein BC835DRAFT_1026153 [Cytidiella melzeri]